MSQTHKKWNSMDKFIMSQKEREQHKIFEKLKVREISYSRKLRTLKSLHQKGNRKFQINMIKSLLPALIITTGLTHIRTLT